MFGTTGYFGEKREGVTGHLQVRYGFSSGWIPDSPERPGMRKSIRAFSCRESACVPHARVLLSGRGGFGRNREKMPVLTVCPCELTFFI